MIEFTIYLLMLYYINDYFNPFYVNSPISDYPVLIMVFSLFSFFDCNAIRCDSYNLDLIYPSIVISCFQAWVKKYRKIIEGEFSVVMLLPYDKTCSPSYRIAIRSPPVFSSHKTTNLRKRFISCAIDIYLLWAHYFYKHDFERFIL